MKEEEKINVTITVRDLPNDADLRSILLEIPEDCNQLSDKKLKQAYFFSMHKRGDGGLFVTTKTKSSGNIPLYPIYPSKENPLRNWKVLSFKTK